MTTWHHAYNGIPTVKDWHAVGRNGFVGNRPPSGHDYLRPNDLSGELRVSLTVVSPTVPGQGTKDGRVVVASRSGATGGATNWDDVSIPVSTLKGVLSSAYEAVTASRMRVFAGHDHVLTHRRTTQESAILYPVFLVPDPGARKGTGLRARIMLGKNPRLKPGQWEEPPYLCAVVLPNSENSRTSLYNQSGGLMYSGAVKDRKKKYHGGTSREDVAARLSLLRTATPHLSRITFTMQEERFYQTKRLIVASINGERFCGATKRGSKTNGRSYTGYVVRLTPEGSDPLIDTKHNEFIFFDNDQNRTYREVSERVLAGLVEVIHSYLENIRTLKRQEARRHEAGAPDESKTRRSDAPNTWLIHSILDTSHGGPGLSADREAIEQYLRRLAAADPGVPLFASIDSMGTITGLSLSQVGRRVSSGARTPAELAEAGGITPARGYAEASLADRMWGFVADTKDEGQDQGAAVRGRITIHPITPALQPEGENWLRLPEGDGTGWILPTLASPKPSTGVPYLHGKNGRTPPEKTTRSETYADDQRLIRKVYPSHRSQLDKPIESIPNVKPLTGSPGPSETAVGSYLAPGAAFTTTISFEGLTRQELAVLVWLLTPERLVPDGERRTGRSPVVGYHRLGFGKPLGLGMVEIRATAVIVHSGVELAKTYRDLEGCLGLTAPSETAVPELLKDLPADFERSLAVRAFVRSAYGWSDDSLVQYPDADCPATDDEISPITTWFKNREENRVKHKTNPQKYPLDNRYNLPGLADPPAK